MEHAWRRTRSVSTSQSRATSVRLEDEIVRVAAVFGHFYRPFLSAIFIERFYRSARDAVIDERDRSSYAANRSVGETLPKLSRRENPRSRQLETISPVLPTRSCVLIRRAMSYRGLEKKKKKKEQKKKRKISGSGLGNASNRFRFVEKETRPIEAVEERLIDARS